MIKRKDDKWLESIHNKMDDFEMMPPDDCWNDIEKALSQHAVKGTFLSKRTYWITAAAVTLLLGSIVTFYFSQLTGDACKNVTAQRDQRKEIRHTSVNTNVNKTVSTSDFPQTNNGKQIADNKPVMKGLITHIRTLNHSTATTHGIGIAASAPIVANDNNLPSTASDEKTGKNVATMTKMNEGERNHVKKQTELPPTEDGERLLAQADREHHTIDNKWTFSLETTYSTKKPNPDEGENYYGDAMNQNDANFTNNGFFGANAIFTNTMFSIGSTEIKLHHHVPIRIGLNVEKRINKHIGIATGITGTYLLSTPADNYLSRSNNQHIYYIGVPIKLNYHFVNGRRLSLYWTNGAEAEKCVYAKRDGERLHINKIQMSVNSALGAQYMLLPNFSIYAEPGVSYYWGNGTNIETYRTENPFSLDFHIGLKLNY